MIHFVGAGPGAEDLITVRGQRYLEQADVVIYAGSLVNPGLLKSTKETCEIYNSAKMTLEEVLEVMYAGEKEGKRILENIKDGSFVIALAIAFYTIRYPITIEAQGKVYSNDSVELLVPYKYLYLFDEPLTARITLEGQDDDVAPIVCPVTSHNDKLLIVDGNHYFAAKTFIHRYGSNAQPGLKVSARIVVSDQTLWQQVFKE